MPRRLLAVLVPLLLLAPAAADAAPTRPDGVIDGRYIVVYEPSVDAPAQETAERERRQGFRSTLRYRRAVEGFAARLTDRQVDRLEADPEVAAVVPDRRVRATGALVPGDDVPTGVARMGAATATTARAASTVGVAVVDTGVDAAHPDLATGEGTNCIAPGAAPADGDGHGTHVAGTIGARNQGTGVVGVAPGTTIHPVKVLDDQGSGTASSVVCGLDWVAANAARLGIRVANLSLGGPGQPVGTCATTTDPEHRAICAATRAGVTVVVAAGNDGWDFDYARQPDTPAAYPEVLTVSAMSDTDGRGGAAGPAAACRAGEADDRFAAYANYAATIAGAAHVVAAPGTCIRSTAPGGGYATSSGTSMATPHVAGAVALCHGEQGSGPGPCAGLAPADVVARVRAAAEGANAAGGPFGFAGDPLRPAGWRVYGHLVPAAAPVAALARDPGA
jgi:subtilisin family serine protease